jgi:hypothetical protein
MEDNMAKKNINENYIHNCGFQQHAVKTYIKSIADMGFDAQECVDILKFYVFNAPVLTSNKAGNSFGLKSLKEYGWAGNQDMSKLEGRLLKSAKLGMFCFLKSDSISQTLDAMNLGKKVCIEHPRSVIRQNCKASAKEDGSVHIDQKETRMECLFRHIRNSLAHNRTYDFNNGNIMLEDCDENGKISARIIIPKRALIDWMKIIKKEDSDNAAIGQQVLIHTSV